MTSRVFILLKDFRPQVLKFYAYTGWQEVQCPCQLSRVHSLTNAKQPPKKRLLGRIDTKHLHSNKKGNVSYIWLSKVMG